MKNTLLSLAYAYVPSSAKEVPLCRRKCKNCFGTLRRPLRRTLLQRFYGYREYASPPLPPSILPTASR
ncbi:hypothetical protein SUGI_0584060 [Cryptomeria japonica]|nr:hypothetical protein SUGI_0584060 [Cryptomeria japonica]